MARTLPPGPRAPAVVQGVGFWARPLAYFTRLRARYGKRITMRLPATPPFVLLCDPDEVKQVFTAPPDVLCPGRGARVLEPLVGRNSVLLLDGDAHMSQRKLMLPAFHGERIAALTDTMAAVAEAEVARWPRGRAQQLQPRMQALTLEIILHAVFGLEAGERMDALRDSLRRMLAFGSRPATMLPPPGGTAGRLVANRGPWGALARERDRSDALLFDLIDERRRESVERDDVLAMLLAARHEDGRPMSHQELRDELVTLLVAGHETTATSLGWACAALQRDPRVLAEVTAEIDAGNGDEYLTAVMQETLRRRPVLPNVGPRYAAAPIEVGGFAYPAGVSLVPSAFLVHHEPDIYPDPYRFRPERFIERPPGTYTWIPFGGGRRRCLGASFAQLEMKIVLRAVLSACELEPVGGRIEAARRFNITVRPADGARATVRARPLRVVV